MRIERENRGTSIDREYQGDSEYESADEGQDEGEGEVL